MRVLLFLLCLSTALLGRCWASSDGFDDVLKMAKAGLGEDVMLAYVQNSQVAYNPNVDEMVFLANAGVPQKVIAAMLERGKALRENAAAATVAATPPPVAAPGIETPPPVVAAPPPVQPIPKDFNPAPLPVDPQPPPVQPVTTFIPADPSQPPPVVTQVVDQTPPPPPPIPEGGVTVSYFYEAMGPYGIWISDPEFGWVWQPNEAINNPHWRPYVHRGHWVWTDQGWFWDSKYPWGWAAFHYGRWQLALNGWVWVPDTVWAPAWVSFRQSDSHFGWAPLPPHTTLDVHLGLLFHGKHVDAGFDFGLSTDHFTFVAANHFMEPSMEKVAVPPAQAAPIFQKTTIVNNYTVNNVTNVTNNNSTNNVTTNNTTNNNTTNNTVNRTNNVVNSGISPQAVAAATNKPVQTVSLADASTKPGATAHNAKMSGNQLTVFRPSVAATTADTPVTLAQRRPNAVHLDPVSAAKVSTASATPAASTATVSTASTASTAPKSTSTVTTAAPTGPAISSAATPTTRTASTASTPATSTPIANVAPTSASPSVPPTPPTPPAHPHTAPPSASTPPTSPTPPAHDAPVTSTPPTPPTPPAHSAPPPHDNPAVAAEAQAKEMLNEAKQELKLGHTNEAKDLLHRIIKLYPQTPSAEAAKEKLQAMGSK